MFFRPANARIYGHPEVATRLGDASGFRAVTSPADVGGVARFHPLGSGVQRSGGCESPDPGR